MTQRIDWPFKLALLACLAVGVSIVAWLLGHGAALFIAAALWALWFYECLLVASALQPLSVQRTLPMRTMASSDICVRLDIQRQGWLPIMWLRPHDDWEGALALHSQRTPVRSLMLWRRSAVWSYTLLNVPRGVHRVSEVSIEMADAFGFVSVRRRLPLAAEIIVHPKALDLPGCLPMPRHVMAGSRGSGFRRAEWGAVGGIDPYRQGDPLARVHWPASLRQGTLYTKSFDPPADRTWLFVPYWTSGGAMEDDASFELVMTLTATALREAGRIGAHVSLALPNRVVMTLGRYDSGLSGADPAVALLDALARCTRQDEAVDLQALLSHVPGESAAILLLGTAIASRQAAWLGSYAGRLHLAMASAAQGNSDVQDAVAWLAERGAQVCWIHEPRDLTLLAKGDVHGHRA
ncbi:hypothetical protein Heshes_20890 [Alicyclobacillus hesperidum]|uniref:DUF58 domain-containing protein n=1 Tax=Alicyclobacillus hesperidum TaxID=89784 RepID=A0AA37X374_9BACL|nr:DUF58 domain-containing protein [Alicyclobacillus hesperidum]GLV14405.1 hypothetical protein Heshes_20890 [Alicyclobacillus hesperidum]